jgi:hypothetical protein
MEPDLTSVRTNEAGHATSLRRVVFPHPLGPRMTTLSPGPISSDTVSTAARFNAA